MENNPNDKKPKIKVKVKKATVAKNLSPREVKTTITTSEKDGAKYSEGHSVLTTYD